MKAMILAAGLGKRMRPLTEHTPKPLLKADGKALIHFHLEQLRDAGIRDVVINTHWCAEKLEQSLGDGSRWQLNLHYSHEPTLLETAGGIIKALPLLASQADEPFLLVNGDIYCELPIRQWLARHQHFSAEQSALLALVENPEHNPEGDFALDITSGLLHGKSASGLPHYTYAGIALFRPRFFEAHSSAENQPLPLAPLLHAAIARREVKGDLLHNTVWMDIGTPQRLDALSEHIQKRSASHPPQTS